MRNPFPKKKSKLPPLGKALAAVHAIEAVREERMDDRQARAFLREQVGLNWSLLTAFQYLTGQEAMAAIDALPEDWVSGDGTTKKEALGAILVANHFCATFHPSGTPMSAGLLVRHFKKAWEQVQEKSDAGASHRPMGSDEKPA